jgi:signal peptidase I
MAELHTYEPAPQPRPAPQRRSLLRARVTPLMLVLVVLAIVFFRLFVVEMAIVDGGSMDNTLHSGDHVLVLKFLGLKRFDVVLLTDPQTHGTAIKRIVGLPGDVISMVPRIVKAENTEAIAGSQLYIDGKPYDEPWAISVLPTVMTPGKIKPGKYFVLGDNRDDSVDSRTYNAVDRNQIHGVAVMVVYPFSHLRFITRKASLTPAGPGITPSDVRSD